MTVAHCNYTCRALGAAEVEKLVQSTGVRGAAGISAWGSVKIK